jgi:2-oxoisovalerate dehydrogenase E1 component
VEPGGTIGLSNTSVHTYQEITSTLPRFPERLTRTEFYPLVYRYMYLSRTMDEKFKELFRKGYVKGTVTLSAGNEAASVGMSIPLRPGHDVLSLLHRDLGAHLVQGATPLSLMCQYSANENSPTHGREGNVHHGNAGERRFPMISHLGNMLAVTVGAVFGARQQGEDAMGLAVIGDGGSSTGDFHESLNIASVRHIPVLFFVENNHYAYSTPTRYQYNCKHISDRAVGYGIEGKTIDGTDAWEVYTSVCDAMAGMSQDAMPRLIECMTLRLEGHAVYDKAEYVSQEEREAWLKREPIMRARDALIDVGCSEAAIAALEDEVTEQVNETAREALQYGRPSPQVNLGPVHAAFEKSVCMPLPSFRLERVRNLGAVNAALDYLLQNFPSASLFGQDIGVYGSAFKSCKGLYEKYGAKRVMDMPLAESATVGFCLGASQTGLLPIMEFQFADFATEAVTQLGLNCGTWFFRTDKPAQILFRLPCGGGINLGAFHSGEFEGLWSRFPGLKIFYPVTPQETFEAIVAGFVDPNPCIVFEHKLLYGGGRLGTIEFNGDCRSVYRPRKYTEGSGITIVAFGAMVEAVCAVVEKHNYSAEVWNPFIFNPLYPDALIESVRKTGRLLVVQESGETAGMGDRIISLVCREAFDALTAKPQLIAAPDAPIPFARELELYHIPGFIKINDAIAMMIGEKCG